MKLNSIAVAFAVIGFALTTFAPTVVHAQNSFGAPAGQNQNPNQPPNQPSSRGDQAPPPAGYGQPNQKQPVEAGGRGTAELKDHGVAATHQLHAGEMHGPTPTSIPGGKLITTPALVELLKNPGNRTLVFDVLGGPDRLPNAQSAVPAHQSGTFEDNTQREFGQYLKQVTQGKQDLPMVFYCVSPMCWMSYNAALRAVNMGYRNVLWYRGGLDAWKAAGQPLQSARQGGGQDGPPTTSQR
jgi:PQQ-dependent catabolism-associated CXXCW motif protein